jgi:small subunit ribosomal protein S18
MVEKKPILNRFKKTCVFCKKKLEAEIDYKNMDLLFRYVSAKGKITSRRISGNCAKHQRKIAREIKRARFLSLIPYIQK